MVLTKNLSIYKNSYAIELFLGEKRGGKTLSMIAKTYNEIIKNPELIIITNIKLNPQYFKNKIIYLTNEELKNYIIHLYKNNEKLKNVIFIIDEIHILFDAREFMSKNKVKLTHFLGQIGKRKNIVRGTSHFPNLIDYRLKMYAERIFKCEKGLSNKNMQWEELLNYNTELTEKENDRLYIKLTPLIRKMVGFEMVNKIETDFFIKANKYFNYYNTEEMVI